MDGEMIGTGQEGKSQEKAGELLFLGFRHLNTQRPKDKFHIS